MSIIADIKTFGKKTLDLTPAQEKYVTENYSQKGKKQMAADLNVTAYLVTRFMREQKLKRPKMEYNKDYVHKPREIKMEVNGFFNAFAMENWLI